MELPLLVWHVNLAGVCIPFSIYNWRSVQSWRSHGALGQICVSTVSLGGCSVSRVGAFLPIRVLKSPHIIVVNWGWAVSIIYSNYVVASCSGMFRFFSDVDGGMYTFIMLILLLLGSISLVCNPYSLPCDVSTYIGFLIYVARPPRVWLGRRCSTSVKPAS